MKYSQFCSAFAPVDDSSKYLLNQRIPMNTDLRLNYESLFDDNTKLQYEQTWQLHFRSEELVNSMKVMLLRDQSYDAIRNEFDSVIDIRHKLYITVDDLTSYL